jgi:hypothetical protein
MKILQNIKLTPTQTLVVNGILSLLVTALMGAGSAAYQYYTMGGKINVGELINIACITFLILFGKSLHDFVPGHAQDLIQSLQDTYNDSQTALAAALHTSSIQASNAQVQAMPAPLQTQPTPVQVVIHTTGTPDVQQTFTPAIDPLATPLPAHIDPTYMYTPVTTPIIAPIPSPVIVPLAQIIPIQ